jgi:transposase-like protein
MTEEMMNLRALLEKSPDAGLLHEMIGFASQRLMELEVGALTGAAYGEKNAERRVQRNGYRERNWVSIKPASSKTRPIHLPVNRDPVPRKP